MNRFKISSITYLPSPLLRLVCITYGVERHVDRAHLVLLYPLDILCPALVSTDKAGPAKEKNSTHALDGGRHNIPDDCDRPGLADPVHPVYRLRFGHWIPMGLEQVNILCGGKVDTKYSKGQRCSSGS